MAFRHNELFATNSTLQTASANNTVVPSANQNVPSIERTYLFELKEPEKIILRAIELGDLPVLQVLLAHDVMNEEEIKNRARYQELQKQLLKLERKKTIRKLISLNSSATLLENSLCSLTRSSSVS